MLERVGIKRNLPPLLVGMESVTSTMENSTEVPKKLNTELPQDPAVPFLGVYLEKTRIQKGRRTSMFIAALFTTDKT